MKIEIVIKNIQNEAAIRTFIERKIEFALDRINARVKQITVKLEDESGDSHAFDGLCRIDASLLPTGQIHVSASGGSAFDSVLQATQKMEHAIKHDIDRHRRSSRVRHQKSKQKFLATLDQDDLTRSKDLNETQSEELGVPQE